MSTTIIKCQWCGKEVEKQVGHVNRARKEGRLLFCGKVCFGLSKRLSQSEKVEIKRLYDIEYRRRNKEKIKARALEYNASPAGRAMQKRNREKFKQHHLEYCRTEKYRKYKRNYDQIYVAKKQYGEYWESYLVVKQIAEVIEPEREDVKIQKGTYNKSQKRKRLWNSMQKTLNKHYGTPYKG